MSDCPICGEPNPWLASHCTCEQDAIDKMLEVTCGYLDWITPLVEIIRESRAEPKPEESCLKWWEQRGGSDD